MSSVKPLRLLRRGYPNEVTESINYVHLFRLYFGNFKVKISI